MIAAAPVSNITGATAGQIANNPHFRPDYVWDLPEEPKPAAKPRPRPEPQRPEPRREEPPPPPVVQPPPQITYQIVQP